MYGGGEHPTVAKSRNHSQRTFKKDQTDGHHPVLRNRTSQDINVRVYLRPGGNIVVNRTPIEDYFNRDSVKQVLKQPLALTGMLEDFDILANVHGGGKTGQAGAVRLGIARACESNPAHRPQDQRPADTRRP